MRSLRLFAAASAVAAFGVAFHAQTPDPGKVDFARDVRPIFQQRCIGCHGPTQQMNGFRLDRRRDALRGGTLPVIGPGNSAGSRLYQRLVGSAFGRQMPPTGALPADQVAVIKAWIDQGAEWPDEYAGEPHATVPDPAAARLMTLLRDGDVRGFEAMLAQTPAPANLKGPGGSTPLMYATLYGTPDTVRRLLDVGADPNVANDAGATALMWVGTDLEKARLLVEHGANVNAKSEDGPTPLFVAAGLHGGAPVVRLLLDHGAAVNVEVPELVGRVTPIVAASFAGEAGTFQLLVERGANLKTSAATALGFAMRAGCRPCVDALMPIVDARLATEAMIEGAPPLAPALGTPLFLERGADAGVKDDSGRTMLMLAAASDAQPVDIVRALLARGLDVNAHDTEGETALSLARRQGNTEVVRVLTAAGATAAAPPAEPSRPAPAADPGAALRRTLPLLQKQAATFRSRTGCVSCHNDTLAGVTVAAARRSGVKVDEPSARAARDGIGQYLESWRERALQGIAIPGSADTISYILLGLAEEGYRADPATDAMARLVMQLQFPTGEWKIFADRPPIESSDIEVTATSMHALQAYAPKTAKAEYDAAVARAADWLANAKPVTTEDRAFQLLGLHWAGRSGEAIRAAGRALAAEQRADGGWSQIPSLNSDAYATGQVLVALAESGAMRTTAPAFRRGVRFLLKTQFADGSWFVRRRALPVQPFFDSGFPHGRDQFISAAATNWAATALTLAYARPASTTTTAAAPLGRR